MFRARRFWAVSVITGHFLLVCCAVGSGGGENCNIHANFCCANSFSGRSKDRISNSSD